MKHVPRGETHPSARLTDQNVREIRQLHAEGRSCLELGRMFSVTSMAISLIVRRHRWKHIS